jgi:hypothetical protein
MDLCWDVITAPSVETVVVACLALLPTMAGIGLILHLRTGRILTLIAQGVQLLGFSSPVFTWMMLFGISSRVQVDAMQSDVPGESYLRVAGHVMHGKEGTFAFGHPHPDYEGYVLSINVLALAVLITVWFLFRGKKEKCAREEGR